MPFLSSSEDSHCTRACQICTHSSVGDKTRGGRVDLDSRHCCQDSVVRAGNKTLRYVQDAMPVCKQGSFVSKLEDVTQAHALLTVRSFLLS